jgi:hypothetical protein
MRTDSPTVFVFFLGRIQHAVVTRIVEGHFCGERSPYLGTGIESLDPRLVAIESIEDAEEEGEEE